MKPPLDLAEVRVRHTGKIGHLAERKFGQPALRSEIGA
jgi:hypothetical protein